MKWLAIVMIVLSALSLFFVGRIVALGGTRYVWEYWPPAVTFAWGVWRLIKS